MLIYDNHPIKHLGPRITAVRTPTTTNERTATSRTKRTATTYSQLNSL